MQQYEAGKTPSATTGEQTLVLIDEPEIHLHGVLQILLLDYIRDLATRGSQFVMATHSPMLIGASRYQELFMLTPYTGVAGSNQLVQVANSQERLEVMRATLGGDYVLTACRNIVCIEGKSPQNGGVATDTGLLKLLCPEIKSCTLLPCGGKSEAIKAAEALRTALPGETLNIISVYALLDRDTDDSAAQEAGNILLPVAMIENWLLNPQAIWAVIKKYDEHITLRSAVDVKDALVQIAISMRQSEIDIRVSRALRPFRILPLGKTADAIRTSYETQLQQAEKQIPTRQAISDIIKCKTDEVDGIITGDEVLQRFRGKQILASFNDQYLKNVPMKLEALKVEIASAIGGDEMLRAPIFEALSSALPVPR